MLLWEIFSNGEVPYGDWKIDKVAEEVMKGYRLSPPDSMLSEIAGVMKSCWIDSPSLRPSFQKICKELAALSVLFSE